MLFWILGSVAAIAIIGAITLYLAVSNNGPAVLNSLDRLAGGTRDAKLIANISTGEHEQQKLIVWGPEQRDPAAAPLPVLLFTHGGSWRSGNPVDYGFIARAFVKEGFIVVLSGYRLGEDGKYPAMLDDTADAVAWVHDEIAAYGGDPDKIVLAGHSAGAYNVVMIALEEQRLGRRGLNTRDIFGVVGLSGPYDFLPLDSDSTIASFGHVETPEQTQPIAHFRADAPPMLLIHGEKDTLVRPRNTRQLAAGIEQAGGRVQTVFYPEMEHNDPLISLAAPWRSGRDIAGVISNFVHETSASDSMSEETSVSVQTETR